MARERAAALAERPGLEVAVGVDEPDAGAGEVQRVLQLAAGGVVVVVALRVHHRHAGGEAAAAGLVEAAEVGPGVAEAVVEGAAQVVVHQPHAGVDVRAIGRGLAEVLAEHHGVVTPALGVEDRVAVVGVGEPAADVELALDLAEVAVVAGVLVGAVGRPEEVGGNVLHGIEAEAVGLGAVELPAGGAVEHVFDALGIGRGVGGEVGLGQAIAGAEADVGAVGIVAVVLGVVGVADELDLGDRATLVRTVVEVGGAGFGGDVDQVGQAQNLHLPGVVPVPGVVPFAVEAVFRDAEVEVLRHEPGIGVDRRVGVVAGDVERVMVHHVVEIDADPEAVRGPHQAQQLGFGAVACAHGAALVLRAEVEAVPQVVADGQAAAAFGRGRQPQRLVAGLGQFGDLGFDLAPGGIEVLEHRFGAGRRGQGAPHDGNGGGNRWQAKRSSHGRNGGGAVRSDRPP